MEKSLISIFLSLIIVLMADKVGANPDTIEEIQKELKSIETEVDNLSNTYLKGEDIKSETGVEKRVADGEIYFRLGDFQRASVIFLDIVDRFPNHPAYPNALFMLAESMFNAKDYYGSRSRFIEVLDHQGDPGFAKYISPSLARLLEISMHLGEFEGAEKYFEQLDTLSAGAVQSITKYVRAKYFFFKNEEDRALQIFQSIKESEQYYPQAQFFIAVIYTKKKDFQSALGIFQSLSKMEAKTPAERKIVNLAKLNAGRLFYETNQLERAIENYESIPPTSDMYEQALYESSIAFIKMGDTVRAERSLEVLSISNPQSPLIPKAKILRGNLLLRIGKFDEAESLFKEIGKQFQPVKDQLDEVLKSHPDPEEYFHELVRTNLEAFDAGSFLPSLALEWIKNSPLASRGVEVLNELKICKGAIEENAKLIEKIKFILESPARVNAFSQLKSGKARANQIENRLTQLMKRLFDYQVGLGVTGEKMQEDVAEMVEKLPVSPTEYSAREKEAKENFDKLAQALAVLEARVDRLQAKIVATKLYIDGSIKGRTGVIPADIAASEKELEQQQSAIESFRSEIEETRKLISLAKSSVGVGDENDQKDASIRAKYISEMKKQLASMKNSNANGNLYKTVENLIVKMDEIRKKLISFNAMVETIALKKSQEILETIQFEMSEMENQKSEYNSISSESQEVVGHLTMKDFLDVKNSFDDLLVKADVGIIDVAWARKEEHRNRVQYLTSERLEQLQFLEDEFKEVLEEEAIEKQQNK